MPIAESLADEADGSDRLMLSQKGYGSVVVKNFVLQALQQRSLVRNLIAACSQFGSHLIRLYSSYAKTMMF